MPLRTPLALAVLPALLLAACDAPEVIPRDPPSAQQAADAPDDAATGTLLAQVEAMKDRLKGQKNPVDILVALGNVSYDGRRFLEAIDWYRQAIDGAKPALDARRALVDAGVRPAAKAPDGCVPIGEAGAFDRAVGHAAELSREGARAQALACYDQALSSLVAAFSRRGAAWALIDETDRGLDDLSSALALDPDDPESLYVTGAVVFQQGNHDDAARLARGKAAWKHFLEVAPDHPQAGEIRALLASLDAPPAGAPAPSAGTGMGGGATPPTAAGLLPALAEVERRLAGGDARGAMAILDQFLAVAPDNAIALSQKGRALVALGQGKEAEPVLRSALEKDRSGRTLAAMGEWYEQVARDRAEAARAYEEAAKADPDYAKAAGLDARIAALK